MLSRNHRHAERDGGARRMPLAKRSARERHLPFPHRLQAEHGLQQSRFAGAVMAEKRNRLATADRQIDMIKHALLSVAGVDAGDGEQRFERARPAVWRRQTVPK